MSSEESDSPLGSTVPAKKRRIQRACDICRQKRRACDGLRMSNRKCTYCIENGLECIYSGAATTTKRKSYTQVLEARLALTEKLLHKLSATESGRVGHSPAASGSSEWSKDSPVHQAAKSPSTSTRSIDPTLGPAVELLAMTIRTMSQPPPVPHGDDLGYTELVKDIQDLSINNHGDRFLGKSSGAMLVKAAVRAKQGYTASETEFEFGSRRMQYWSSTPWKRPPKKSHYAFPPADVLSSLIQLYFTHTNIYLPLLHRPTFERAVAENLHLRDDKFAVNLLLVCAVASRFSDDPRVFDASKPLSCGYDFFAQIETPLEDRVFDAPTLYDLQYCCLATQFLEGSAPQANWPLIGMGIRLAQEVGAHRRQLNTRPSVESELWKRAFWVLVHYDRQVSCTLGRPCALHYDDFDIDLPTECDDEYWETEDPAQAFRQLPGKPSRVAFFNAYLRLSNILAFSLRILYSLNKTKDLLAVRDDAWEEHLVAELDSALNKWVDEIPEHLRWDPHRADLVFFRQSVALYCGYYYVQMTTHRPFIPTIRQAAPTALPSLAICTNAARSCSHVAEVSCQRMGQTPVIILLPALTTAGIVLLLNVWSGHRTGLAPHMNSTIDEVHKCMRAMRVLETRWQMAGMFWDILSELANVGHVTLPLATPSPPALNSTDVTPAAPTNPHKRGHESDGADDTRYMQVQAQLPSFQDAGALDAFDNSTPFAWVGAPQQYALPMYSEDLGRLPVYPQSDFVSYATQPPAQGSRYPMQPWAELPNFASATSGVFAPAPAADALDLGPSAEDIRSMIDNDAITMWANAPMSLGVNEWGTYFSAMNDINQDQERRT
ncbi:fungal-specific transcription factor domain-containing protein [Mycena maculata]|uniref:Fungal-specific transcription factor domain-containing protein n=1 Tax=Mycena maculata TaxID=230809 RepID=A0AAD7K6N8_9AGAR|nr:fungal-specific transcription factor domain-containing protein [Mycena maculata]